MSASDATYKPAGYCPDCGYAIDPGVCPECGRHADADELDGTPAASKPGFARLGPIPTAILMAVAVLPLLWAGFSGPFLYVLSLELFFSGFDPAHVGGALDQPSITKWYFIFTFLAVLALPWVALVRVFSNRRSRAGYWAYVGPAITVCVCLLLFLTIPFWWVLQYIAAMGFTVRRLQALGYGLGAYATILLFMYWVSRPPRRHRP